MESTFFERFSTLCKEAGQTPNSVAKDIGASSGSVTAWKNGAAPRNTTVAKIASYFGVSIDYLLGTSDRSTSMNQNSVNDEDIKFALFGGSGEITDAMYDEVRQFAAFIMRREEERKRKE